MISIKKFLNDDTEVIATYERIMHLLMQGIALHAVDGHPAVRDVFRAKINEAEAKLGEDRSPANALTMTGEVIKALQEYNQRATKFIRAQGVELQSMVGMLTQAMAQISAVSEMSVTQLQELQKQIEHATQLEDIRTLKTRLGECLVSIRDESARHREESTRVVAELDHGIRQVQTTRAEGQPEPAAPIPENDRIPGILGRTDAEKALRVSCEQGAPAYAGLFIVDRLKSITSRFGNTLADQVIAFFAEHLLTGLTPQDRIYRWDRGTFFALLDREEAPDFVRKQLARLLSRRLDHTFEIEGRAVAVPIASTWTILPLRESNFSQILRKIEVFTASGGN